MSSMNYLNLLSALATLYAEMATGGAKAEADKILTIVVTAVSAVQAAEGAGSTPSLTAGG